MAINLSKVAAKVEDVLSTCQQMASLLFEDKAPNVEVVEDFVAIMSYIDPCGVIHVASTLYTAQRDHVCVDSIVHDLLSQLTVELHDVRQYNVVINPTQFAGQEEWTKREIEHRRLINSVCTNV